MGLTAWWNGSVEFFFYASVPVWFLVTAVLVVAALAVLTVLAFKYWLDPKTLLFVAVPVWVAVIAALCLWFCWPAVEAAALAVPHAVTNVLVISAVLVAVTVVGFCAATKYAGMKRDNALVAVTTLWSVLTYVMWIGVFDSEYGMVDGRVTEILAVVCSFGLTSAPTMAGYRWKQGPGAFFLGLAVLVTTLVLFIIVLPDLFTGWAWDLGPVFGQWTPQWA